MMSVRAMRPGGDVLAQCERTERVVSSVVARHTVEAGYDLGGLSIYRALSVFLVLLCFESSLSIMASFIGHSWSETRERVVFSVARS